MELRETAKPMNEIMAYQNDRLLERYVKDYAVSKESAARRFEALKQFMYLCAATPGYKVTSEKIDSMWHTFLLFTKDYHTFCHGYLGRFINHEPFETPAPDSYLMTRSMAQRLFGNLDEDLWPKEAKVDCTSGCQD